MSDLINKLFNKNYDDAKSLFEEKMSSIVEKKKVENKKVIGAKLEQLTMTRKAFDGNTGARAEKLYRGVIEEKGPGLWANIRAKKARGERMRKPGEEGAPTEEQIKKARNEEVELEEKYGKGYVSAASKIERAMKKRGVQPNSSDKYRKEMERLDAQYKELQAKDKKIDEDSNDRLKAHSDLTGKFGGIEINSPLIGTKYGFPTRSGDQGFAKFKKDLDIKDTTSSTPTVPSQPSFNKNKPETGADVKTSFLDKFKIARQKALDNAGVTSQTYKDLGTSLKTAGQSMTDVARDLVQGKPYNAAASGFTGLSKTIKSVLGNKDAETAFDKLPLNLGTLAKHASGVGGGIKDVKKFDTDQQNIILNVGANARDRAGGKLKPDKQYFQTGYPDYKDMAPGDVGYGQQNDLSTMAKNTQNKGYQVKATLGAFGVKPLPSGKVEVKDIYDFNGKTKKAGLQKDIDSGKAGAYATIRNQVGEKGDLQYSKDDERQKTSFVIPKDVVAKNPNWQNYNFSALQPARPITPTPSTAYKAVSEPKAMTQATPKTVSAQPKPRSEIGKQFDAAYADAKKLSKTSGQKTFSFKGKDYALNEDVELDEARINIIKARIRGGKVQRRKKVSNVPGMTLRSGRLIRMSPAERRRRRLGQKRGKIKRRMKLGRTLVKRQRSLRKRQSLGLK